MTNCVGGFSQDQGHHDIHSLRDENDLPYVTFKMRRRGAQDWDNHWGRNDGQVAGPEVASPADTGHEVLATSSVLGRNNEAPKESYGKHLVEGLSGLAKAEKIPHVSWDQGPLHTPQDLDDFLGEEKGAPPTDLYMKVPVGMKTEDGGVRFKPAEGQRYGYGDGVNSRISVSTEPLDAQFGYHVFKTPYSEKRFDKKDDLGTRLNHPLDVKGGYQIKTIDREPTIEGLKPSQVTLMHEAKVPEHMYLKMSRTDWMAANRTCPSCSGDGKDPESESNLWNKPNCPTCHGTGRGNGFSLKHVNAPVEASPNEEDFLSEGHNASYDHHIVKVPFSEENFTFSPNSGKFKANTRAGYTGDNAWHNIPSEQAEITHKAYVPSKLYVAVPSTHRGNRYVYSEDGLEPVFMKNNFATNSSDRANFVGAKGNDILEIDTSKLDEDHFINHTSDYARGQRRNYNRRIDKWNLNPEKPIPYEAITHNTTGAEYTEGQQGELAIADPSEQNKRKKHVTPIADEDGKLRVTHPELPKVDSVAFATNLHGRTIEGIKSAEAGNVPKDIGIGTIAEEGRTGTGADIEAHIENDPDLVTEVTPTMEQLRKNEGGHDYDNLPQDTDRTFKLKEDIPAGHNAIKQVIHGESFQTLKGERPSIIPDTAYIHVPRRMRGNEDLYGEKGIDLNHVTENAPKGRGGYGNYVAQLQTMYDKPISGSRDSLQTGEDPSEFDVWAVDPNKIPNATLNTNPNPYDYRGRTLSEDRVKVAFDLPTHALGGSANPEDAVPDIIPWEAVKQLHRKPEEPTAPAVRKFFNTASAQKSITGWKHLFLVK